MTDPYNSDIIKQSSQTTKQIKQGTFYNSFPIPWDLQRHNQLKDDIRSGYKIENEKETENTLLQNGDSLEIEKPSNNLESKNTNFYKTLFTKNSTIYLGLDKTKGPFVLSLAPDEYEKCRGILHTKNGITPFLRENEIFYSIMPIPKIKLLVEQVDHEIKDCMIKHPANQSDLQNKLVSEEEKSNNNECDEFLNFIVDTFQYSGDLDVNNNLTGTATTSPRATTIEESSTITPSTCTTIITSPEILSTTSIETTTGPGSTITETTTTSTIQTTTTSVTTTISTPETPTSPALTIINTVTTSTITKTVIVSIKVTTIVSTSSSIPTPVTASTTESSTELLL